MNYKVSVIIPCYNVEDTIQRAVNSIINQTLGFENIQLLLYDDVSTDNTKQLLKDYSKNYENIYAIFGSVNKGPGFGRNKCLNEAFGEFVMFLDADDEFDLEMCDKLYSTAKFENADLVCCGVFHQDNITTTKRSLKYDAKKSLENTEDKIVFMGKNIFYLNDHLSTHCLFNMDIVKNNNVHFLEIYYAEDIYFKDVYRCYSNKVVYLKNYFGYIQHADVDSITDAIDLNDLNNIFDVFSKILDEVNRFDLDLAYLTKDHIMSSLTRLYTLNLIKAPKIEIISFLKRIRALELRINFNYSLGFLINILNFFIMHEYYNLAYAYLHFLRLMYNSNILRRLYRLIE